MPDWRGYAELLERFPEQHRAILEGDELEAFEPPPLWEGEHRFLPLGALRVVVPRDDAPLVSHVVRKCYEDLGDL